MEGSAFDSLWPSAKACGEIMNRLDKHNFPYAHKKLIYKYSSHILLPFETLYGKLFPIVRKYPKESRRTVYKLPGEVRSWLRLS